MPDATELERRIVDLELKFMEQQRLLEDLSLAAFTQDRVMARLTQQLQRLVEKSEAAAGLVGPDADDKPPHY